MAEALHLPPLHVHAIRVPIRKTATKIGDPDELFLQQGENGGVQVDAFWRDATGKEIHDSKELNEDEYETLRTRYLKSEQATLPPFNSFKSGNTVGRVVGETAPAAVPATQANPPIEAETEEEGITGEQVLDGIQLGLDVVGLIPVIGEAADIISAGISLARGDYVGAGLSLLSAIPFVGYAGSAGKAARYGAKMAEASGKAGKEAVDIATKKTGGKTKGTKKTDPCAALQNGIPGNGYRGGKHGKIKKGGKSYDPNRESHHTPADSAYSQVNGKRVSSNAKPSIQLDVEDHKKTASWGSEGKAYRALQSKSMQGGKSGYRAAMMMDIEDVRSKFGNKYDVAIAQMLAWAKCKEYI
ncbi:hypothetical protein [Pseudomonas sp. TWR3-1-1]|uniref:hypothetical protein n=1 Tax=Pseudomonas sp. TWR3-1-1 TaxID=2804633 RepID=UPI003CF56F6D